jgi:hypothetical protein
MPSDVSPLVRRRTSDDAIGYPDGSNGSLGTPTYWGYIAGINSGSMPKIFQAPGDPTQRPGGGRHDYDGTSYIHICHRG